MYDFMSYVPNLQQICALVTRGMQFWIKKCLRLLEFRVYWQSKKNFKKLWNHIKFCEKQRFWFRFAFYFAKKLTIFGHSKFLNIKIQIVSLKDHVNQIMSLKGEQILRKCDYWQNFMYHIILLRMFFYFVYEVFSRLLITW